MKTTMLTIWILALALIFCSAEVSEAAPMGAAFTYQGFLYDANSPADGEYDLEFTLYDDPNVDTGNRVAGPIEANEVDVYAGAFTMQLDFGRDPNAFNGEARWLGIRVRPGEIEGANAYAALSPRQEITPVPYALQTRGIFVDSAGNVGITTSHPTEKLHVNGDIKVNNIRMNDSDITDNESIRIIIDQDNDQTDQTFTVCKDSDTSSAIELLRVQENGNVGIGTTNPNQQLQINNSGGASTIQITSSTSGSALLDGLWIQVNSASPAAANILHRENAALVFGTNAANRMTIAAGGNVGIGTTSPTAKLHVGGTAGVDGIKFPDGTLQTTAAGGGGDDLGNHIATQNIELNSHWLSGDGGNEGVFVNNAGNVGIGTTNPGFKLDIAGTIRVQGSTDAGIWLRPTNDSFIGRGQVSSDFTGIYTAPTWKFVVKDNGNVGIGTTAPVGKLTVHTGINDGIYLRDTSNNYKVKILNAGGDGVIELVNAIPSTGVSLKSDGDSYFTGGNVGIGTTSPSQLLHVAGKARVDDRFYAGQDIVVEGTQIFLENHNALWKKSAELLHGLSPGFDIQTFYTDGSERMRIDIGGNVGIGTVSPQGKLDVNGSIYQRGSQLHADYVFEPDYQLESIDEHSEFMWQNRHLPAIPKAKVDEAGREIVEVGAHRKGIVEELEKAHIYIEQLHNRINELKTHNEQIQARLATMEAAISQLIESNEGGQL